MLVTVLIAGMSASYVSASIEGEIKQTAQRLYKITTQKLPRIAWTVTKGCVAAYSLYLAAKTASELGHDLKAFTDDPSQRIVRDIFEHGCGVTAFGWLGLYAGHSFLKDVEKL